MIVKNPLTGVGLGNYPITRNNPDYRDFMADIRGWDLSALGWFDLFAETGLIVGPSLLILFIFFLILSVQQKRQIYISLLLFYQILAHLTGVQFTFFYPWTITLFGILYLKLYPSESKI